MQKIVKVGIVKSKSYSFSSISQYLSGHPYVVVVGVALDTDTFFKKLPSKLEPDVILITDNHSGGDRLGDLTRLCQRFTNAFVIYFPKRSDVNFIRRVLNIGASGVIQSDTTPKFFLNNFLSCVQNGKLLITPLVALKLVLAEFPYFLESICAEVRLTRGERYVLELLQKDNSLEEIAQMMDIRVFQVERYLSNIFQKIDLSNCISIN